MRFRPIHVVLFLAAAATARAAEPQYAVVATEAKRIRATLEVAVSTPELTAKEWVLFTSAPPTLPSQRDVSSNLSPNGVAYLDLAAKRPLLRAVVPVESSRWEHRISATATFEAQLVARSLVRRVAGREYRKPFPLSPAEKTRYVQRTTLVDLAASSFTSWFEKNDLQRRTRESDVDLGRRAFLAVTRGIDYDYNENMDRRASNVCTAGTSDCGGMAVLFAAAMRANKVPARILSGAWAKSAGADDRLQGVRYYQTHVKAEFYAEGVGWVPVDLSSAVLHDRTAEGLQYFGRDPGDFLTMHVDPELKIDSIHFGIKTINWMQQYNYFVTGSGTLRGVVTGADWKVETIRGE